MTTGRVNVGGGGGGASLNIFTQLSEPQKKDGLWLKTSDKFRTIFQDLSVYLANSWVDGIVAPLPQVRADHATVLAGDYIYVFGGRYNTTSQGGLLNVYKYNIRTNVWSYVGPLPYGSITSAPLNFHGVYKNGIIYLHGRIGSSSSYIKRFDVATETWLSDAPSPPYSAYLGHLFEYGENGLLLVQISDSAGTRIYSYDIVNKTWKSLNTGTQSTYDYTSAAVHLLDNKVYMVAGRYSGRIFDIATDTWTTLTNPPASTNMAPTLRFGTDIYIYGRGGYDGVEMFIFDTLTNTYSYGPPLPHIKRGAEAVFDPISKKVYIVGGYDTANSYPMSTETLVFTYISKQYSNDELVLLVNPPYSSDPNQKAVELFSTRISVKNMKFLVYFLNAWIFKNGDLKECPAYYGDGTKWTKFKN